MMVTYARDDVPGFNEVKPVCQEDIKAIFPTVRFVAYLTWASVDGCVWKKVLVNLLFIIVPFNF